MASRHSDTAAAVAETLRLAHAWLAYLLTRLGEETVRVEAADLRRALDELSCSVSREGNSYVIALHAPAHKATAAEEAEHV